MIVYLTWGETPRSYGVFGSQVVKLLSKIKKAKPLENIKLVSGLPIVHSGLLREGFSYRSQIDEIRKNLSGVDFHLIPLFTHQGNVNSSEKSFHKLHSNGSQMRLFEHLRNARLVHCRSYHAAYAAICVKEKFSLSYSIVFDVRGYWPEEVSFRKNFNEPVSDLIFRKRIEKIAIQGSQCVVSVSDTMAERMEALGACNSKIIYLSAEREVINSDIPRSQKITLGYCGALGRGIWHDPICLADLYRRIKEFIPELNLKIITSSPHSGFIDCFSEFDSSEIEVVSAFSNEEVMAHLSGCDLFALSYRIPTNFVESVLASSVLSTKFVEYALSGGGVLCNLHCGGAAKLVRKHDLGIVYDPQKLSGITSEEIEFCLSPAVDSESIRSLFSFDANAQRYADLYDSLPSDAILDVPLDL